VNVTFKPPVLRALDGYASKHHLTRAAALEHAVTEVLGRTIGSRTGSKVLISKSRTYASKKSSRPAETGRPRMKRRRASKHA